MTDLTSGQLLAEALRLRGYDGLVNVDLECGCYLHDLEPCGSVNLAFCLPGYKQVCAGCGDSIVTAERDPGPVYCIECQPEE